MTIIGWGVGFVGLAAIVFGIAWALTPKAATPATTPAGASSTAAPALVPTVAPTPPPAATQPTLPATVPTTTVPTSVTTHTVNTTTGNPLAGKVVVIDAGHQRHGDNSLEPIGPGSKKTKPAVASGTQGVVTKNPENVINLAVSLKLRDILQRQPGVKVVMIRTTPDVDIPNS